MKCRGQNRKNFGTCCHCSNSEENTENESAPAPAPAAPTCSNDHLATDDHSGCEMFWYRAHLGCGGRHMSKEEAVAKVPGYKKCTDHAYMKCMKKNPKDYDTCCHCSNSEENTENESAPAPAPNKKAAKKQAKADKKKA